MRKLSRKEIKHDLQYNTSKIQTKYDNLFDSVIRQRGNSCCYHNQVTNYHHNDNEIAATVEGTKPYNVHIIKGKELKAECTCPYYKKDSKLCKHIYAVILEEKN